MGLEFHACNARHKITCFAGNGKVGIISGKSLYPYLIMYSHSEGIHFVCLLSFFLCLSTL